MEIIYIPNMSSIPLLERCNEFRLIESFDIMPMCGKCRHCFVNLKQKQIRSRRSFIEEWLHCYKSPILMRYMKDIKIIYLSCKIRNYDGKCDMFEDIPTKESYAREYKGKIKDPLTWVCWKKIPIIIPVWDVIDRNRTSGIQEPVKTK